jgi:hypothetical protein
VNREGRDTVAADWDAVSSGYFEALEVPIVRGRAFTERDRLGAGLVAIVNEQLAAEVWPGEDPVGKILLQSGEAGEERPLQIVGVARNAKHRMIGEPQINFIYVPLAQQFLSEITFYARRTGEASRAADLRRAVAAFDPDLPVIHSQTLAEATAVGLLPQRLAAWIAGAVGAIGLLLAAIGLYGLTAFTVAQRTRELAVRVALGATHRAVLSLVMRQSATLAGAGAVVGLGLALGVGRLLQSLLIGISPVDPIAFATATSLLVAILLGATWAPARRASRLDPMRALRAE